MATSVSQSGFQQEMTGSGAAMTRLRLQLQRVGPHYRTVLLCGEKGSGKELAARMLHGISPVKDSPFVVCSAVTFDQTMIADVSAEHIEQAAATARGGTLFVDEIGDMSMESQNCLLHVLRRQEWGQRGLAAPRQKTDIRLIASSSEDLRIMASTGGFRRELYRQISMVEIMIPPLRERMEDIPELAIGLLTRLAQENGRTVDRIADTALELLQSWQWPGNVRELEAVLQNSVLQCEGHVLEAHHLPELSANPSLAVNGAMTRLQDVIDQHVLHVLRSCGGNKLRAAEVLGISRSTLYRMLDASAID